METERSNLDNKVREGTGVDDVRGSVCTQPSRDRCQSLQKVGGSIADVIPAQSRSKPGQLLREQALVGSRGASVLPFRPASLEHFPVASQWLRNLLRLLRQLRQ